MDRRTGWRWAHGGMAIPVAALIAAGCAAGEPGQTDTALLPGGISASVRTAYDSATAAFEAGDFRLAHELFAATLAQDSTLAAAWIGLHLSRNGDPGSPNADSALGRARSLIEPPPLQRGRGAKPAT